VYKNEVLNRVLLLMKYDNRQTLSENVEKINLSEQYSATNEKLWSSVNSGDVNAIKSYSCGLSKMTFTELTNLFKSMAPKSGVITPDLFGFQTYNNPTIASTILENEIYLRRLKNIDSFEKIMIPLKKIINVSSLGQEAADTSNNIGSDPQLPESTLLSNKIIAGKGITSTVSYYAAKSATLICSEGVVPAGEKKQKSVKTTGNELSDCPLPNLKEGNKFRLYVNSIYPELAKKKKSKGGVELDLFNRNENSYCNSFIKNAYYFKLEDGTTLGQKYERYIKNDEFNQNLEIEVESYADATAVRNLGSGNVTGTEEEKERKKQQEKEEIGKILEKKSEIINNPIVKKVFPNVNELMKDEDCKIQYLKFFQGIIDGTVKNKNNRIVGKRYYNKDGQMFIAKWNESTPPCTDEFWDKHGWKIQVGAAVVAGILLPGYGWGLALQVLIDAGLNAYSLQKAIKSQDEDRIKLESLYLLLPILMATRPVRVALENLKFTKETIESLSSKLSGFDNLTTAQKEFILTNLTAEEKRALTAMSTNSNVRNVIENTSKETIEKLKSSGKYANVSTLRKISEPLTNLFIYGAPMVGYVAYQIANIEKIAKEKIGRPLNKEEKELFGITLSLLSKENASKFVESLDNLTAEEFKEKVGENGEAMRMIREKETVDEKSIKSYSEGLEKVIQEWMNGIKGAEEIKLLDEPNPEIIKSIKTIPQDSSGELEYAPGGD
jgi:hypothetical protein